MIYSFKKQDSLSLCLVNFSLSLKKGMPKKINKLQDSKSIKYTA